MWLFIESTQPDSFRVGALAGRGPKIAAVRGKSHCILTELARRFSPADIKRADGICVVQGPGSFTAIRTGVLVANLLARLFKKPLVGVTASEAGDTGALAAALQAGSLCATDYVAPQYLSEPNITVKLLPL
jgi:tRNA A37 threonylcarbamoyltransferase TsaD